MCSKMAGSSWDLSATTRSPLLPSPGPVVSGLVLAVNRGPHHRPCIVPPEIAAVVSSAVASVGPLPPLSLSSLFTMAATRFDTITSLIKHSLSFLMLILLKSVGALNVLKIAFNHYLCCLYRISPRTEWVSSTGSM